MSAVASGAASGPAPAAAQDTRPRLRSGWTVVAAKELADHFLSVRFGILLVLLGVVAAGGIYAAAGGIRDAAPAQAASGVESFFLGVLTAAPAEGVPAFYTLVGFLAPLLGIAFGFDAVNGERSQGTLPRLLSQPIHRDDVINGKFAAGLGIIATMLVSLVLLVSGVALLRLGIAPSGGEIVRIVVWLLVTIVYVGFWLGLATLCSVVLRRAATSALVAIFAWLLLTLFFGLLIGLVADAVAPVDPLAGGEQQVASLEARASLGRLSPTTLYEESTLYLLQPDLPTVGPILTTQLVGYQPGSLDPGQSLLLATPQLVALVALNVALFAAAYIAFMRQEVRA